MSSVVIAVAILSFTALKAGPALLSAAGRPWNDVLTLAWPLCVWVIWLVLLYSLLPGSGLVDEPQRSLALGLSCGAVTLVCGVPLARFWWNRRRPDSSSAK